MADQTTSKHSGNLMMSVGGMAAETFARLGESDTFRGVQREGKRYYTPLKKHTQHEWPWTGP